MLTGAQITSKDVHSCFFGSHVLRNLQGKVLPCRHGMARNIITAGNDRYIYYPLRVFRYQTLCARDYKRFMHVLGKAPVRGKIRV